RPPETTLLLCQLLRSMRTAAATDRLPITKRCLHQSASLLPASPGPSKLTPIRSTAHFQGGFMRVFLAEKPSQAKDIDRALGAGQHGNGSDRGAGVGAT